MKKTGLFLFMWLGLLSLSATTNAQHKVTLQTNATTHESPEGFTILYAKDHKGIRFESTNADYSREVFWLQYPQDSDQETLYCTQLLGPGFHTYRKADAGTINDPKGIYEVYDSYENLALQKNKVHHTPYNYLVLSRLYCQYDEPVVIIEKPVTENHLPMIRALLGGFSPNFENNSNQLESDLSQALEALQPLAAYLQQNTNRSVQLVGVTSTHKDDYPYGYNYLIDGKRIRGAPFNLSEARARQIESLVVNELKIPSHQISVKGTIAGNRLLKGVDVYSKKNRRVDIVLYNEHGEIVFQSMHPDVLYNE